jgi:hypothetical protein
VASIPAAVAKAAAFNIVDRLRQLPLVRFMTFPFIAIVAREVEFATDDHGKQN